MATMELQVLNLVQSIAKAVLKAQFPILFQAFDGFDASAAGLSAFSGLQVLSEMSARRSRTNLRPITLVDLFYKKHQVPTDQVFYIPDSEYDPFYDYDFTDYKGDDSKCTRGGKSYTRPAGWKRKAVKVIGKYEDDVWLGTRGWRDESSSGEWPVSYHGTKQDCLRSIVADGYDSGKCERKLYGDGIYSSPDPKVAEWYAKEFVYQGEKYKCILQNRVNFNLKKTIEINAHDNERYFLNPNDEDIRPYGVCLKKI